ncbi:MULTISPECIES: DUF4435 domain-containing protein [unclassified Bradyrhizobium]|uniref:DUF4435 domain-containing protein n=1 Tax=unclassified Bradyrhizobium TaxID=2631580 RepID=UPI0028EE326B|nr:MULTISPECIES: DUF4435 domain-containing protein [unclassified Bradyrhizobium]
MLKLQILSVRSREKIKPIFVFEGPEDLGPFSVWIGRCDDSLAFEPIPASGKDQILRFRDNIKPNEAYLKSGIYFFVDRDFDDLKGYNAGPDLFLTDMYSIENYLVSERVLTSILVDEFKCAGERIEAVLLCFGRVLQCFHLSMRAANLRIFAARRLGIGVRNSGLENRITKFVVVELDAVKPLISTADLLELIPLDREPTTEEMKDLENEFDKLEPSARYRGKFILSFFLRWLDLLAEERWQPNKSLFATSLRSHFSSQQLSKRSLATRSELPHGLRTFIELIRQDLVQSPG